MPSLFQHTAARRRLATALIAITIRNNVSTHSRPKAAGQPQVKIVIHHLSFNTQPPEGGWRCRFRNIQMILGFNTQPPEGGWTRPNAPDSTALRVSTHSRPKAAGHGVQNAFSHYRCFNTQPPEGGWRQGVSKKIYKDDVSTHSRPKAAGICKILLLFHPICFNTQPPEGGWYRSLKFIK